MAVVTGAGDKAFCAGAGISRPTPWILQPVPLPNSRQHFTNGPGFGGITRTLNISKPIVAAINGYAISEVRVALACDIKFCSPNAEFALQDVKWGFHACDGGLIRLPQIVGLGNAMEIVLSGERIERIAR